MMAPRAWYSGVLQEMKSPQTGTIVNRVNQGSHQRAFNVRRVRMELLRSRQQRLTALGAQQVV